jgi:membrane fusion protein (multidrug efflux system)
MVKAAEAQVDSDRQAIAAAEASVKQAQTAIETAKINLDYTQIIAPISGRIGKSALTTGAMVTAYQAVPLATVQQLDPIYVDVSQSTYDLLRLKKRLENGQLNRSDLSQQVKIILEDGTGYAADGTLQFCDVSVDPTTASVTLRVVVPNAKNVLLPGMFVRAVVSEGINEQAILIPQQSVSRDPKGNPKTLVVNGDKVEQRMLTLDRAIGDEWLVLTGLAPGDRVIVEGLQKARIGEAVKVVTPAANSERAANPQETPQPATASK